MVIEGLLVLGPNLNRPPVPPMTMQQTELHKKAQISPLGYLWPCSDVISHVLLLLGNNQPVFNINGDESESPAYCHMKT